MRIKFIIVFVVFISGISVGQIGYHEFGEVFPDDVMFVEDIGEHEILENIKDTIKQNIMLGFRNTDINSIQAYLSPKLQTEVKTIDSLLNTYETEYNSVDSVYLLENSGYLFGQSGTTGITKFSHKLLGELSLAYQYYRIGNRTIINRISVNGKEFPSELSTVSMLKSKIENTELSNKEKFDAYQSLLEFISPKEGEKYNDFYLPESPNELSRLNGNLSWYAINIGENEIAVSAATKGLLLDPSNEWINTNLALGLAQSNRLDEALNIYTKLKNKPYRDKIFKEVFLADIEEVEANGIKVKCKKKIIKILTL